MSLLSPSENVVESQLTRFEADWKNADLESLKSYLTQQPEVDTTLLPELLLTELELSIKAGERFQLESYLQAFPELASDQTFVNQIVQAEYELRMRLDRNHDDADLRHRFPDVNWNTIESSFDNKAHASTLGGAFAESFELLEKLLPDKRRIVGSEHLETILAMHDITMALIRLERFAQATEIATEYVDVTRRTDYGYLPIALSTLGESLFRLQRFDEAELALEEASELFGEGPHSFHAFNQVLLGRIALAKEDLTQAKALLTQGAKTVNLMMKDNPANYRRLYTAESMVALHTALGNPKKQDAWEAKAEQQAAQIQSRKLDR